ncbi:2Fe-2S iron-sulfur cluster-binding protein [Celeribacter indicus]|uniref:GntR family transcriptional regulator n=1 Tax=Celeribacter indicus TaxID=1208324 RepID=A0A0B5DV37_9RHOB|nr:2Fe-2S iron-sulfur cluster-binding protein [Celeribacter indicus]AJE46889.1 GntR family transcriptional regulator [Celeribacter indicus]SDW79389.1 CDP-4-dehydro-6-deoxyglucose reductase [Celeribacter indicus]
MTIIRALHKLDGATSRGAPVPAAQVTLAETGESFAVEPHETLLAAALNAGVDLAHDCKSGYCGSCRIRVLEGEIAYDEEPAGLSGEERGCGFALACQARVRMALRIEAERMPADRPEPAGIAARVVAAERVCGDITRLRLAPEGGMPAFLPGQYLDLVTETGATRSFSIASAPAQGEIELHIRRIPGGMVTSGLLPEVRPGDPVRLHGPHGLFRLHPGDFRPLLFVATGTGIAPIRAMLAALRDDPDCPPVALYWGMREESELYLAAEIAEIGAALEAFSFVPVLSRADAGWTGRRGHVQEAVLADLSDLPDHAIYLCGSPAMIAEARTRFLEAGASANHIYADCFHFAHNL